MSFDLFTNSQTQIIQSIMVENPSNYVEPQVAPIEAENTYICHNTDSYHNFPHHQLAETTAYPINNCPGIQINTSPTFDVSNGVPAMELWPGDQNFNVEFSKAQDKTKATPWIVSQTRCAI